MVSVVATGGTPGTPPIPGLGAGFQSIQQAILLQREQERLEEEKAQKEAFNQALISATQGGAPLPGLQQGPTQPASLQDSFMQAFQAAGDPGMDPAQLAAILQPQTATLSPGQRVVDVTSGDVLAQGAPVPEKVSSFGQVALDLGYDRGTPDFQKAVRAMAFAENKSTSETERMLALLPEAERGRVLRGILLTKAGLAPHQMTEVERLAAAKGLQKGTPEYAEFVDEQIGARQNTSEFTTLLEGLDEEQRAEFLAEMRTKRAHIDEGTTPTKALVDAEGSVKASVTNSIRNEVLQTLFDSIYDPITQGLRLLDPTQGPKAQGIIEQAERLISTGQEKGVAAAVSAAARAQGFDIPSGGPRVEVGKVPTEGVTLPQGVAGAGTFNDPLVGASVEFLQTLPKPVYYKNEAGKTRVLK